MEIDAFDDVVALQKCTPGGDQQVRQPGVGKGVVPRLGGPHFAKKRIEASGSAWLEAAREAPGGILLEQGLRLRRGRGPGDESRAENGPPELVVGRLVDKDVVLAGKEPSQRAGRELVAPLADQVGGAASHDQVDLELGMAVAAGSHVSASMSNNPALEACPEP